MFSLYFSFNHDVHTEQTMPYTLQIYLWHPLFPLNSADIHAGPNNDTFWVWVFGIQSWPMTMHMIIFAKDLCKDKTFAQYIWIVVTRGKLMYVNFYRCMNEIQYSLALIKCSLLWMRCTKVIWIKWDLFWIKCAWSAVLNGQSKFCKRPNTCTKSRQK